MKVSLFQLLTIAILGVGTILAEDQAPINTVPEDPWGMKSESTTASPNPLASDETATPSEAPSLSEETQPNLSPEPIPEAVEPEPERTKISKQQAHPELRDDQLKGTMGGFGRFFEFRAGARGSALFGKLRPGGPGSSKLDLRDDLKMKDVDIGPELDFEMQISKRTHVTLSYAQSGFASGQTTTTRPLAYHNTNDPDQSRANPAFLPIGSGINSSLSADIFSGSFRYDLVQGFFTFAPLVGFKTAYIEENTTITSATPGISPIRDVSTLFVVTPTVGFDARLQLNRHLYVGITPAGFGFENYYYIGGEAFVHLDFNKDFGLRLGADIDHVGTKRNTDNHFSTTSTLTAFYLQGVYGF